VRAHLRVIARASKVMPITKGMPKTITPSGSSMPPKDITATAGWTK
jgi:hypothetical protein